jgi:hypothetical protein
MDYVFGDLEVEFPDEGWVAVLNVYRQDGGRAIFPLFPLFTSIRMIQDQVDMVREEMVKSDIEVSSELTIIPCKFESIFQLKPEYWVKPAVEYDQAKRINDFEMLIKRMGMGRILVTPSDLIGERFTLVAAMPVFAHDAEAGVELFMKMSDFVVNERAKNSGIYRCGQIVSLNWTTGEIVQGKVDGYLGGAN